MKPWNERSGRMWAGMESIVRFGLREGRQARGTVSAGRRGIKAIRPNVPHGEERILRVSNHEARVRGCPSRRGLAPAPPAMSAIALTRGRGTYPGRYAPGLGSR